MLNKTRFWAYIWVVQFRPHAHILLQDAEEFFSTVYRVFADLKWTMPRRHTDQNMYVAFVFPVGFR